MKGQSHLDLARKRGEAIERQRLYNTLSTAQKIAQAQNRRGNSAKELRKLAK